MRNIRLDVAYDGTDYSGWQRQADDRSIQGAIEDALQKVLGESPSVTGSGRTDEDQGCGCVRGGKTPGD